MRQKKGALPLLFLLSLVLTIIILASVGLTACNFGKGLFRLSGAGKSSFEGLVNDIRLVNAGEDVAPRIMTLDKGTAVVGFTAGKEYVYGIEAGTADPKMQRFCSRLPDAEADIRIKRPSGPDGCEDKSVACVCRCQTTWEETSVNMDEVSADRGIPQLSYFREVACGSAHCQSSGIEPVDFADTGNLFVETGKNSYYCFNFENGFFIPGAGEVFVQSIGDYGSFPEKKARAVVVHSVNKNGKDEVAVCENPVNNRCVP